MLTRTVFIESVGRYDQCFKTAPPAAARLMRHCSLQSSLSHMPIRPSSKASTHGPARALQVLSRLAAARGASKASCRRWRPYHIHNAVCVEASRGVDTQIKGCGTIGSNKALAKSRGAFRSRQRRWSRGKRSNRRGWSGGAAAKVVNPESGLTVVPFRNW
jgi:hypothetical protein